MLLKRIIDLRENNNLTQKDMTKILNIGKSTYARWETDEALIPLKHLNNLCIYFDVSMDYMIGFTDKNNYTIVNKKLNNVLMGKRLKQFRHEQGLTQTNLAEELNTAQSVISSYESGKTRILTAFAYEIVKKYGVSLDWLCGRID